MHKSQMTPPGLWTSSLPSKSYVCACSLGKLQLTLDSWTSMAAGGQYPEPLQIRKSMDNRRSSRSTFQTDLELFCELERLCVNSPDILRKHPGCDRQVLPVTSR